ncbi:D-methionine transport system ATP-binding protein [Jeotgalicoccus aerolatus]|uniref:D-methionine transport system ATP-binding protein n=1 Tax=Jeotgalicoccus aerolatus TaxID=709510 RepID=A0A1G8ZMY4_9STAP|nr:methionine ABC transporter ATP-binding protein [Jeotgalicoccus aerolatus]NMA80703.1 methionine ABC transporter ATP-binding protein [Jeotgalicoccus aerolatus]SDK16456.1 D-methionine transport system ATP-binding protein [Jeotgalicoccus aerolatus]HJG33097.1 methionine ABC transporter ATP-binding protein [Jeotgalicoccus aerolatus]
MIDISNVSKIFKTKNQNITAVDNVELNVKAGEIFGVIGYSGAGKSTLIRLLNGLEQPSEGTVTVTGDEISKMTMKELRKKRQKVSMIFQHFNLLWSRTVAENISFPLEIAGVPKKDREARVAELIRLVGLEGRENNYPSELSGGQKQRVGIARALSNEPEVLLCDEATSALDPETTDEVLDLLVDITKTMNLTIVLITHEMHVIRKICDRAAVMENGKVVEVGPVIELFQNPQSEVTKRFVKDDISDDDHTVAMDEIKQAFPTSTIVKLTFVGTQTKSPIVSEVIRNYSLDMNILSGNIKQTNQESYGHLFIALDINQETLEKITEEFARHDVTLEVESQ